MDSIRNKQEKIAKNHFEQDFRLTESKYFKELVFFLFLIYIYLWNSLRVEGEDHKAQSMRDLEELTRQVALIKSSFLILIN